MHSCGLQTRFVRRPPADNDLLIYSCLLNFSIHAKGSPRCTFNLNLSEDFWEDFLHSVTAEEEDDREYIKLSQTTLRFNQ